MERNQQEKETFFSRFHKLIEEENPRSARELAFKQKGINLKEENLKKSSIFMGHKENFLLTKDKLEKTNGGFNDFYDSSEVKKGFFLLTPKNNIPENEIRSFLGKKMLKIAAETKRALPAFREVNLPYETKPTKPTKPTKSTSTSSSTRPSKVKTLEDFKKFFPLFASLDNNFDSSYFKNYENFIRKHSEKLGHTKESLDDFLRINQSFINYLDKGPETIRKLQETLIDLFDDPADYIWVVRKLNLIMNKNFIYNGSFESMKARTELKLRLFRLVAQKIISARNKKSPGFKSELSKAFPNSEKLSEKEFYVKSKVSGWARSVMNSGMLETLIEDYFGDGMEIFKSFVDGFDFEKMTARKYWGIIKEGFFRDIKQVLIDSGRYTDELFEKDKEEYELMVRFILEEWEANSSDFIEKMMKKYQEPKSFGVEFPKPKKYAKTQAERRRPTSHKIFANIIGFLFFLLVFISMSSFLENSLMSHASSQSKADSSKQALNFSKSRTGNITDVIVKTSGRHAFIGNPYQKLVIESGDMMKKGTNLENFVKYDKNNQPTFDHKAFKERVGKSVESTKKMMNEPEKVFESSSSELEENKQNLDFLSSAKEVAETSDEIRIRNNAAMYDESYNLESTPAKSYDDEWVTVSFDNPEDLNNFKTINRNSEEFPAKITREVNRRTGIPNDILKELVTDDYSESEPGKSIASEFIDRSMNFLQQTDREVSRVNPEKFREYVATDTRDIEDVIEFESTFFSRVQSGFDIFMDFLTEDIHTLISGTTSTTTLHRYTFSAYLNYMNMTGQTDSMSGGYRTDTNASSNYFNVAPDFAVRNLHTVCNSIFGNCDAAARELDLTLGSFDVLGTAINQTISNAVGIERQVLNDLDQYSSRETFHEYMYGTAWVLGGITLIYYLANGAPQLIRPLLFSTIDDEVEPNLIVEDFDYEWFMDIMLNAGTAALNFFTVNAVMRQQNMLSIHFISSMPSAAELAMSVIENKMGWDNLFILTTMLAGGFSPIFMGFRMVSKIPWKRIISLFLKRKQQQQQQQQQTGVRPLNLFSKDLFFLQFVTNYSYLLYWIASAVQGEKGGMNIIERVKNEMDFNPKTFEEDGYNEMLALVNEITDHFKNIRDALGQRGPSLKNRETIDVFIEEIIFYIYLIEKTRITDHIFPENDHYRRSKNILLLIFPFVSRFFSTFGIKKQQYEEVTFRGLHQMWFQNEQFTTPDETFLEPRVKSKFHRRLIMRAANHYKLTVSWALFDKDKMLHAFTGSLVFPGFATFISYSPFGFFTNATMLIAATWMLNEGNPLERIRDTMFFRIPTSLLSPENWGLMSENGNRLFYTVAFSLLMGSHFSGYASFSEYATLQTYKHYSNMAITVYKHGQDIATGEYKVGHITMDNPPLTDFARWSELEWQSLEFFEKLGEMYRHIPKIFPAVRKLLERALRDQANQLQKTLNALNTEELTTSASLQQMPYDVGFILRANPWSYLQFKVKVNYSFKLKFDARLINLSDDVTDELRNPEMFQRVAQQQNMGQTLLSAETLQKIADATRYHLTYMAPNAITFGSNVMIGAANYFTQGGDTGFRRLLAYQAISSGFIETGYQGYKFALTLPDVSTIRIPSITHVTEHVHPYYNYLDQLDFSNAEKRAIQLQLPYLITGRFQPVINPTAQLFMEIDRGRGPRYLGGVYEVNELLDEQFRHIAQELAVGYRNQLRMEEYANEIADLYHRIRQRRENPNRN